MEHVDSSLSSQNCYLIQPEDFARYLLSYKGLDERCLNQVEAVVILGLNSRAFEESVRVTDATSVSDWIYPLDGLGAASRSRTIFTGKTRGGRSVSLASSHSGGPASSVMLEMLIAGGGRKFIVLGTCAGLSSVYDPGTVFVPDSVLGWDGTSQQYLDKALEGPQKILWPQSEATVRKVVDVCRQLSVPVATGRACTIDGFFATSHALVDEAARQGCSVLEMELGALLAVAQRRCVDLMALLVVSDHFAGLEHRWVPSMLSESVTQSTYESVAIALELIDSMEYDNVTHGKETD